MDTKIRQDKIEKEMHEFKIRTLKSQKMVWKKSNYPKSS